MKTTKIEWTEVTWNPTTGCTKISTGCKNCYAEKMALRLKSMGIAKYKNGFEVALHPELLKEPYKWNTSRMVFVNSMSDLFHEDIPFSFIEKVFKVMNDNLEHTFQILTKRAELLYHYSNRLKWTPNIWVGVTVESAEYLERIDFLREVPAAIRFLSLEPLLSPLKLMNLRNIDWVIVGGESGPNARHIEKEWVLDIQKQCEKKKIAFFFKQWGGINKKKQGRILEGKIYDEMPTY